MSRSSKLELVLNAIDKASGPIGKVERAIAGMERAATRSSGVMGRLGDAGVRAMNAIGTAAKVGAVAGILAVTAAMTASIAEAAKFEDLWSDANKTLALSPEGLERFQDQVNDLSSRIPMLRSEIVEMTGVAGRMGIKDPGEQLRFVELAATAAAAFGTDASRAAGWMGEWREQLGYGVTELGNLADKVNWLGNNTKASEAQISDFYASIAGIAKQNGLSEDATLALGAAMIASGRDADVASTSMRALFREMAGGAKNVSGPQQEMWKRLGLDADRTAQKMQTDGVGAMREVVSAIDKLPGWEKGGVATLLFGEEAYRGLGPLLTDMEALEKALARIDQFGGGRANGMMGEEFKGATDDVLDNWKKLQNVFSIMRDEAGQPFLEPINNGLKGTIALLTTLDERATVFDRMGAWLQGFANGLGLSSEHLSSFKTMMDDAWTSVSTFLFGVADRETSDITIGKLFYEGIKAGRELQPVFDAVGNAASRFGELVGSAFTTVSELALTVTERIGPIDFSGVFDSAVLDGVLSTLTGIRDALSGFATATGTVLVDYFRGYFDGLEPYLGPMVDRLSAIWDRLGPILDNFGRIGTAIGGMFDAFAGSESAGSSIEAFGRVMGTLAGIAGNVALGAIEGMVRWIEAITGAMASLYQGDWAGAQASIQGFLDWLGGLSFEGLGLNFTLGDLLPDISVADVVAEVRSWFDFKWVDVFPRFEWRDIIPEMPSFDLFGSSETEAPAIAAPDVAAPEVTPPSIDTVLAAQDQVDALNAAIAAATTTGQALPGAIGDAIRSAQAAVAAFDLMPEGIRIMASLDAGLAAGGGQALAIVNGTMASIASAASLDLTDKGANIMNTLAAGMRSRAAAVVEEIRRVTQSVRDHLPSSPAKVGPLSDIHRLKFAETIASSIHPEPLERAMSSLASAGMAAAEPRARPDIFATAAASSAPGDGGMGGAGGSVSIDASLHIGTVHYASAEDKQEFEALLQRHSRAVADVVAGENRRQSRLAF